MLQKYQFKINHRVQSLNCPLPRLIHVTWTKFSNVENKIKTKEIQNKKKNKKKNGKNSINQNNKAVQTSSEFPARSEYAVLTFS